MNKNKTQNLAQIRKSHHLKLKDVAFILDMNLGNLSSFETGKISSPKALLGYHTLFNLSIQNSIKQVIHGGFKGLLDRCLKLSRELEHKPTTQKNKLRQKGLSNLIIRLMELKGDHE